MLPIDTGGIGLSHSYIYSMDRRTSVDNTSCRSEDGGRTIFDGLVNAPEFTGGGRGGDRDIRYRARCLADVGSAKG